MKVMFVIPTLGTGGAERVASILASNFAEENEVEFFILEKSNVERYRISEKIDIKEAGIDVKRGNKMRAIMSFVFSFIKQRSMLQKEIGCFSPKVVISFLPKADILVSTVMSCGNFRWIPSERNDPMSRSWVERSLLNVIYKKASPLVCQTEKVANYYQSQGVNKTCVIRNPVILNTIADPSFCASDEYIISVGRLDRQKNYEMLIRAFSNAKRSLNFSEKLYILGNGPEEASLNKLIEDLEMTNEVYLLGRKSNVMDYLSHATAFVMSSNYEGLPNAMLEAMAAGLPIITTNYFTGAATEFVDKDNGFVVPVSDINEMEKAIANLLSMPKEKKLSMGEESRRRVAELDAASISRQWRDLLNLHQ